MLAVWVAARALLEFVSKGGVCVRKLCFLAYSHRDDVHTEETLGAFGVQGMSNGRRRESPERPDDKLAKRRLAVQRPEGLFASSVRR